MREGVALISAGSQPDPAMERAPVAPCRDEQRADREAAAFDELVRLQGPRITRLVHRLLGWRGDVDDVVQDVFLAALKHRRGFRHDASLSTWLTAIAVNRCRSHRRSIKVLWKRFGRGVDAADVGSRQPEATPLAGAETAMQVQRAVQALSARDREVVVFRYFEGLSPGEIAALTGQSKNAVEVRLHRARARLAGLLGDVMKEHGHP